MTPRSLVAQVSLHQRDTDIDVRERFLEAARAATGADAFILATCHRVELTCLVDPEADTGAAVAQRIGPLPAGTALRTGHDAVQHLIRAACGLDSVVRGEAQVLGQLRRAFDVSREKVDLDPTIALVVRRALEAGRELRNTTALGTVRRSLGSLAVDAALADQPDPLRATVLVIGAGEVGKLAIRALASRSGAVLVANRDPERSRVIARLHGASPVAIEEVATALGRSSAVIAAADTRGTVLSFERLRARLASGPLTVVDLAVPRSVESEARTLAGLRYVDVDGLSDVAGADLAPDTIALIEERCASAAGAVMREIDQRRAAPAIRALHERAESIRVRRLREALARLAHLSARDQRVVESLSEVLAHELLHEPTVRLRAEPDREAAARDLFAL